MSLDYTVMAAISYNLEDALEELTHVSEMFRPNAEIDESEFKVRMAHLYSHLNTAWNLRNVTETELELASSEQMSSWSRFPTDLEPL